MGSFEDHKREVEKLARNIEDQYDIVRTEFEYYDHTDHTNPVGEIDVAGITEDIFDIYEVKTSHSDYCYETAIDQLLRAGEYFKELYNEAGQDMTIGLYLKIKNEPIEKLGVLNE